MAEVKVTRAEIYHAGDGWRFRLLGSNRQIIATGESYTSKANCEAAVRALGAGLAIVEVEA